YVHFLIFYITFLMNKRFLMRTSLILSVIFLLSVWEFAEAQPITIKLRDGTIRELFEQIRTQTQYDFVYDNKVLNGAKKVTIDVKDKPLEEILKSVLSDQPVEYTIDNKTVILRSVTNKVLASVADTKVQQTVSFQGKVVDSDSN